MSGLHPFQSIPTGRICFENKGDRFRLRQYTLRDLQLDQTRILDLRQEPGWQPREKSFGFNGFGFNAGRFKLQNGELVELYLAKETTAVLIPRRGNVPVMVGVRDPNAFLAVLQDAAAR